MGNDAAALSGPIADLRREAQEAGRIAPEVVLITRLPLEDPEQARDRVQEFAAVGVTRVVHAWRYADAAEFARVAETMATRVKPAVGA
jgi:hypothetical protein